MHTHTHARMCARRWYKNACGHMARMHACTHTQDPRPHGLHLSGREGVALPLPTKCGSVGGLRLFLRLSQTLPETLPASVLLNQMWVCDNLAKRQSARILVARAQLAATDDFTLWFPHACTRVVGTCVPVSTGQQTSPGPDPQEAKDRRG